MAYSNYVAMVIVCNSDSLKVLQRIKNQIRSLKSVLEKHGSLKVGSGKVPISILKSSDPRAVPHNGASYCCGHHEPGIPAISPSVRDLPALLGFTIPCALHC